jgi:hypothetical protein
VCSFLGGEVVVEVPAESFDFLEDVEVRKVSLQFLNEESVGSCEERITREVMLKVVKDCLNGGVESDDRLRMVVNHESSFGLD